MSKFLDGLSTPGGRSFLLAALWIILMVTTLTAKLLKVDIQPEGRAAIAHASDELLGALILSMGIGASPKTP